MRCPNCGNELSIEARSCPSCGQPILGNSSPKSRLAVVLLCFFLGSLGIHRFYVGKIGTGILMLVTLGCLGIWTIIDFVIAVIGKFRDKEGRLIDRWE